MWIQNPQTKTFQHKSPDLQRTLSKPLYIRKMVKKGRGRPQKSIFSKNEKFVKNYQCDDPKKKQKSQKKISNGRTDVRTYGRV